MTILFIIFVFLQLVDSYTTQRAIRAGGRELNPILRELCKEFGAIKTMVVTKTVLIVLGAIYILPHDSLFWLLAAFDVFYIGIAYNNIMALKKMGVKWTPF